MRTEFISAIKIHQSVFGFEISKEKIERLADYYEIVQEHNPLLHLVAPCSPEEFATRHMLESLTLLEYLPENARFVDVGAGGGLPSIPCMIVRDDLMAVLIESKEKKTRFLEKVVLKLELRARVEIVNRQFEEADSGNFSYVTCRALDKFGAKLPRLLKWSKKRVLLLFGGIGLRDALVKEGLKFEQKLMPLSERRYLFVVEPLNSR